MYVSRLSVTAFSTGLNSTAPGGLMPSGFTAILWPASTGKAALSSPSSSATSTVTVPSSTVVSVSPVAGSKDVSRFVPLTPTTAVTVRTLNGRFLPLIRARLG